MLFDMNILHLSDTHGAHRSLGNLPEADVIVHSGDITMNGSNELLSRVTAVRPRIHLFGHSHTANGLEESNGIIFSNAAIMNEHYDMLLEPHLIKL